MRISALMLTFTLTLAACGQGVVVPAEDSSLQPRGTVTATVLKQEVARGERVDVQFENQYPDRFWFHPCPRTVERLDGTTWVALPPELRMCTAEIYALDALTTRVEGTDVPADATTGTHRFVFQMNVDRPNATPVSVHSTPFVVR